MKKKNIIIITVILLPILIFWLGGFHFSKHYVIGRNVPFKKANQIRLWKDAGGSIITGVDFFDLPKNCCNEKWEVKKDTLYFAKKPVAKVISIVHRGFIDYELTIQSFDGQKTGSYISK